MDLFLWDYFYGIMCDGLIFMGLFEWDYEWDFWMGLWKYNAIFHGGRRIQVLPEMAGF